MQREWFFNPDTQEEEQIDFEQYSYRVEIPFLNPADEYYLYSDDAHEAYSKASEYAGTYRCPIEIEMYDSETETWRSVDENDLFPDRDYGLGCV